MNKEPTFEEELDEGEVTEVTAAPEPAIARGNGHADGSARDMVPRTTSSSPPPTRFNTAAPLAPPRPNSTGSPARPSNVPPAPRIPASQAVEKIAELQEQLDLLKRTLSARDAEIRTLLTQRDARTAELEGVKSQLAAREFSIKELEFAVLAKETKIRDLEEELEAAQNPGEGPGDDLQQIRGIGRGFERELRRIGIRTFAQIAAWTPADIDEIAPQIKAQPERIRRDGWVQRAGELVAERNK
jgi:predicted flap endonuclease-1-like 5' DNA nuclease